MSDIRPMSDSESDNVFGPERRVDVGKCYTTSRYGIIHYYKQTHDGVLHISGNDLINRVNNSVLKDDYIEITSEEFDNKMREVIFNLEIYQYLVPKE
jgi:hypothetical protein